MKRENSEGEKVKVKKDEKGSVIDERRREKRKKKVVWMLIDERKNES